VPHPFEAFCFVAVLAVSCSFSYAEDPESHTSIESASQDLVLVVANPRMRGLIATWTDASVECLFDGGHRLEDGDRVALPSLPIARMLRAKCYVYCPSDEHPIEAIYRERLANHGVQIISLSPPSARPSVNHRLGPQRQSLLAALR